MCKKIVILALAIAMLLTISMAACMFHTESAEGKLSPQAMTSSIVLLERQGTSSKTTLDSAGTAAEADELNNKLGLSFTVGSESKPELIVSSISWTPVSSGEGDRVTFSVVVENLASVDAGGFEVAYYVDGVKLGEWSFSGLSGGGSSTMVFYWIAVGVGSHSVMVIVDVYDEVMEEDEWNNDLVVSFTVGPSLEPDLAVSSMSWTPVDPIEGDRVAFRFTVENLVAVYAGGFTVAYYVDDSEVGSHYVTVSVDIITFYWDAVGVGSHSVMVVVDVYDEVVEEDETNNVLELSFSVHPNTPSTALVLANGLTSESRSHPQTTKYFYDANIRGLSTESSVELLFDDGGAEGWLGPGSSSPLNSHVWFVHFNSSLESTQLLRVMFCINATISGQNALGYPCRLHIMDFNKSEIFLLEVTPSYGGWFAVDLESYFIVVPQHFFVGIEVFHSLQETEGGYVYAPVLGYDINEPDGKSWWVSGGGEILWIPLETYDVMIRAVVSPAFNSPMSTDLDGNGKVDILDIAIVAMAFGTKSEDPNYNPVADLAEPYGEINIADIAKVARDYGKTSEPITSL